MAILQTATTSFKTELAQGLHNFGPSSPDTFKIALFTGSAELSASTTAYTPGMSGEVVGTGYTAGGETLVIDQAPTTAPNGVVAYWSFANATWSPAAFTARGALIYNSTNGNRSVCVLDFGSDKTATTTFTVQFPAVTSTSAILRIS